MTDAIQTAIPYVIAGVAGIVVIDYFLKKLKLS